MKLHPQYVVGFIDGEGSFYIDREHKRPCLVVTNTNLKILKSIAETLGVKGYIKQKRGNKSPCWDLSIRSYNDVKKVVEFFEKHSLRVKHQRFEQFKKTFEEWKYHPQFVNKRYRENPKLKPDAKGG